MSPTDLKNTLWRAWPAAALAAAALVLITPLWLVATPNMPDYPAHLAGFHLIAGGADKAPLAEFYAIHWVFVPNLGSEILVPIFARGMALNTAVKLFLSLAVLMWVLGPAAIQRAATGRFGPEPLAGAFFAYNANFTWGFFNYFFASGFAFVLFAIWIWTAKRRGPAALFGFALAILALYTCHLIGAVIFLTMAVVFEVTQSWQERGPAPADWLRRLVPLGLIYLPVAFAYFFLKPPGTDSAALAFNFSDTIGDRMASTIQSSYDNAAYLLIGGLAILTFAGFAFGKLKIVSPLRPLVLVLAVLAVISPEWALGGWGVDLRLPAVLGAVMFAASQWCIPKRAAAGLGAVLFLALCWNAASMAASWKVYDKQYREFRTAIRQIPPGSKIVTVIDNVAMQQASDQPYWHMAEFAIPDRSAFTTLMFTTKGQHVVQLRPPYDRLAAGSAEQGSPPDVSELYDLSLGRADGDDDIDEVFPYLKHFQCNFDIVLIVTGSGKPSEVPYFLALRHEGSFFSLYDVHPTPVCDKR